MERSEYAQVPDELVEQMQTLTETDVEDFLRLLPQLTTHPDTNPRAVAEKLQAVLDSPTTALFVIRDDEGHIQATTTANICRIPTGTKPWIDDVVTDEAYRGKGYGEALINAAHEWFLSQGVFTSNLTSAPERVAAGGLYERLGYQERQTRVYRAVLDAAL
jgi:GNAT superfamily N-acetyltransferase